VTVKTRKGDKACKQYQSALCLQRQPVAVFPPFKSTRGSQALIGRFETACIPCIPLVAEFCTDHIEKAVFVTLASIFSKTVGGMKLKFGEEIGKKLIFQDPSPFR